MYHIGMIFQAYKKHIRHGKFSVCVFMQGKHRVP